MSDPMPAGWNRPAPATKDELVATLEDALACVRADDSFEGFIEWSMAAPDPTPCPGCDGKGHHPGSEFVQCGDCRGRGHVDAWEPGMEGADFGLRARYRVGNSMGQGGVCVFQPGSKDAS